MRLDFDYYEVSDGLYAVETTFTDVNTGEVLQTAHDLMKAKNEIELTKNIEEMVRAIHPDAKHSSEVFDGENYVPVFKAAEGIN